MQESDSLTVEWLTIGEIKPYTDNPRVAPQMAIDKVAASIQQFGWRQPIVVDKQNVIIAGHTRYLAAQQLQLGNVPVHIAHGLSPEQVSAYRLADNRVAQETTWDMDLLRIELGDLKALDFNLEPIGFSLAELSGLLDHGGGLVDPDEAPEPPVNPVTCEGDVWLLGKHRIACGDSTQADTVAKCLNGVEPHLMVTDPPYGVNYQPEWRNKLNTRKNYGGSSLGKVLNDDCADWSGAWSLFPGDVVYVWCAPGPLQVVVHNSLIASGLEPRTQIIWSKSAFTIGRGHYHYQHECCWYAVRKSATGHWQGSRKESTIWQIDKANKNETGHSTQKPIECMKRPILNNSSPGQAIYEPFAGSGTTIIAAEMTGRACHAIELSPEYVDVCVNRWQNFTGKEATLEASGQTYADVLDDRYDAEADSKGSYDVAIDAMREKQTDAAATE